MAEIIDINTRKPENPYEGGKTPNEVLQEAVGELEDVLVIGWTKDKQFFQTASKMSRQEALYLVEITRKGIIE